LLFGTRSPAPNKYLISNLQTMSKAQNYTAFLHSSALESSYHSGYVYPVAIRPC
jgi:hypothetical protein